MPRARRPDATRRRAKLVRDCRAAMMAGTLSTLEEYGLKPTPAELRELVGYMVALALASRRKTR